MSGFVGILHRDGRPIERAVLERLNASLCYRGPEEQQIWLSGNVGLGHALLRTTSEAEHEHQPFALDGNAWIVADARIDYRAELIRKLKDDDLSRDTPGAELILRAYRRWGVACVEHLLGDFSFAVWDAREQTLFCARDHFGVKPFFYAECGPTFLFGNDLNCLRGYPQMPQDLDEPALVDFMVFGHNRTSETTSFSAIRRLAPAHAMQVQSGRIRSWRYWTMPISEEIRYAKTSEYGEHFREKFSAAIANRMRATRISSFMSGGLDSTAITALAVQHARKAQPAIDLLALTCFEDIAGPDEEQAYGKLTADFLKLPSEQICLNGFEAFDPPGEPQPQPPEPHDDPFVAGPLAVRRRAAQYSRTVLTGYGGDAALFASNKPLGDWSPFSLLFTSLKLLLAQRRVPRLGFRTAFRKHVLRKRAPEIGPPNWLRTEILQRFDIQRRWKESYEAEPQGHPRRPDAYAAITDPVWQSLFQVEDPGSYGILLELQYPFFDVPLLEFLFGLPAVPWFVEKHLLREAMRGLLPELIRRRPKTVMQHPPIRTRLGKGVKTLAAFSPSPRLNYYLDTKYLVCDLAGHSTYAQYNALRLVQLDRWLKAQGADGT